MGSTPEKIIEVAVSGVRIGPYALRCQTVSKLFGGVLPDRSASAMMSTSATVAGSELPPVHWR